jgi:2-haloacid dehalogenase
MTDTYKTGVSRFKAINFDLLTALIDSWSLWVKVAGDENLGRQWRRASLKLVTSQGAYRRYEDIVSEAANQVGVTSSQVRELFDRWLAGELKPWPEVRQVLAQLADHRWSTAVVTNCSQPLAEAAAAATGHNFDAIISAERAGVYKTDPRAYRAGVAAVGEFDPSMVLFVAGSAHDVPGATAIGMPVYWSNRHAEVLIDSEPSPFFNEPNLLKLPGLLMSDPNKI